MFIGYFIPTALLALPTSVLDMDTKQSILASWQLWPLSVSFLTTLANLFFPQSTSMDDINSHRANIRGLRYLYAFAFACAAIPHITAWSISIASVIYPSLFNVEYLHLLHPWRVFVNQLPLSSVRVSSVDEGSLWFLQWDNVIGSTSLLLWAWALYHKAHREAGVKMSAVESVLKIGLLLFLAGPAGAAVELIWERDELVFSRGSEISTGKAAVKKSQ